MRQEWILRYDDYLAAQALFNRRAVWRRIYMFAMLWVFPGIALLLLTASLYFMYPDRFSWSGISGVWPIVLFAFLFRVCYWNALRKGYKRMFLGGDPAKPIYMELDDDKVISGVPGSSEGRFDWSTISGFSENDRIAILHISKRLFLILPKNRIQEEAWAIIAKHLPGAAC